jgi:hypothetical protein
MPCKEQLETLRRIFWLYRSCTASFDVGSLNGGLSLLRTSRRDDFEPHWQDETDWLCTVEFLPTDDPPARIFASDIIGYLFGYAHLTNTRSLALVGDPDANAYELLFSFSSSEEKKQFLELVRSNPEMGNDYIENDLLSPTTEEIKDVCRRSQSRPHDSLGLLRAKICSSSDSA